MQTLIAESQDYSQKALDLYKKLGPVVISKNLLRESKSVLHKTDIIVLRLAHKIDAAWMDKMPNLKIIATPTTGLNHVDEVEAKKRGIKIISLRGHTSFLKKIPSTAEEAWGLLLALIRNLPAAFHDVKQGRWNRDAWKGHQLFGMTLGIVGLGRIGLIVARYAKAFGMNIVAYDPHMSATEMKKVGVKKIPTLEKLCELSDVVSLHVLLTDTTHNIFSAKHFQLMKRTAYFLNTARGELVQKGALEKALAKKWIAGAAIDVMWDEAGDGSHLINNTLLHYAQTHDNLIIVPHIGGATYGAMHMTEDFIADLVVRSIKKK